MSTIVRLLSPDDVHAYAALRREMLQDAPWAFSSSPTTDARCEPAHLAQRLVEPGSAIIGAFDGAGSLVGAAGLARDPQPKLAHRAVLWGMYVTPGARRQRVGDAIVAKVIEHARTWPGLACVHLAVSSGAPAARRLYERHGFVAWGTEPDALRVNGRSYDETYMRRVL